MPTTYSMDKVEFREMARTHRARSGDSQTPHTLIACNLPADMETPVSALLKVRRGPYSFLLESVERGSQVGRYSFLGTEPRMVLSVGDGISRTATPAGGAARVSPCQRPLDKLRELLAERRFVAPPGLSLPRFTGGAVGYAGYETVCSLEPVGRASNDVLKMPDMAFAMYDSFVVFDHVQRSARLFTTAPLNDTPDAEYEHATCRLRELAVRLLNPLPPAGARDGLPGLNRCPPRSNCTQAEFEDMVLAAKEHIAAGDIIQVVLSQRFDRPTTADPFSIYRALRMLNPSPYMFFLQFGDIFLIGASPEMLVQVQNGRVATHPIAGTRPRGADAEEDIRLERELVSDEKERAEHLMLVDLARNDIGRIARIGSVAVPTFMDVQHFSHVMHLVSEVTGILEAGLGPVDVLKACFPAGTVSGAPKVRAMQIIREQERDRRGPYAGAAGYVGYDGNMDTAIVIRTVVMRGGAASVQAGAGIVADSEPSSEYRESLAKARAMLAAIDLAEEMEQEEASRQEYMERQAMDGAAT